jgi:hypothetical protein
MRESALGLAAGAVATVALVAGCGSNTAGNAVGSSDSASTTAADSLWDPCSLPDGAIQAIGLDPSTKKPNDGDGYLICGWKNDDYGLSLYSLQKSLNDVKANPVYAGSQPVTVARRHALQLPMNSNSGPECDIAIPVSGGTVLFGVLSWSLTDNKPPCGEAMTIASSLARYIPGGG